jgi:hypothetical protein
LSSPLSSFSLTQPNPVCFCLSYIWPPPTSTLTLAPDLIVPPTPTPSAASIPTPTHI